MEIMLSEMDGREAVHQVRAIEKGQGVQSTYGVKIIKTTTVQDIQRGYRLRTFKKPESLFTISPESCSSRGPSRKKRKACRTALRLHKADHKCAAVAASA
jgi:CheY-like chemotaxis protein